MAMIDHTEATDQADFESHLENYRFFVRLLWSNVAAIAVLLIGLAAWAG